jgi:hypothetical protein
MTDLARAERRGNFPSACYSPVDYLSIARN